MRWANRHWVIVDVSDITDEMIEKALQTSMDTLRKTNAEIPRDLFQHFIRLLDVDSGWLYWLMDILYAPYEWKSKGQVEALLRKYNFKIKKQLMRGVDIDQIEQVSKGLPYAKIKYGEAQLKFLAVKEDT